MPGRNSARYGLGAAAARLCERRPVVQKQRELVERKPARQGARDEERAFLAVQRPVRQSARLVQVDEGGHCVEHCLAEQRRAAPPLADDDDHRPLAERAASGDLRLKERRQRLELVRRQASEALEERTTHAGNGCGERRERKQLRPTLLRRVKLFTPLPKLAALRLAAVA